MWKLLAQLHAGVISVLTLAPIWLILLNPVHFCFSYNSPVRNFYPLDLCHIHPSIGVPYFVMHTFVCVSTCNVSVFY